MNQRLHVHDNQGFASAEHIKLSVLEVKPNGIPVHTPSDGAATKPQLLEVERPMSDGKRTSKPVTAAESFRYAQEKEDFVKKFRNKTPSVNSDLVDETKTGTKTKSKLKKKKKAAPSVSTSLSYENLNDQSNSVYTNLQMNSSSDDQSNPVYTNLQMNSSSDNHKVVGESPHSVSNGNVPTKSEA